MSDANDAHQGRLAPQVNLNLNVRGMRQSATVAINDYSKALQKRGRQVVKLGLGQSPFPVPRCVVAALREQAAAKDYLPSKGLPELRQAVADYHRRADGVDVDGESVLIGPGSKELMFLLQLAYYGDLVVPSPCWVSYAPQARIIGRQVRFVPTTFDEGWRLLPDQLKALCEEDPSRPRIVILNYPGNPDGNTYTRDELQALAAIARQYKLVLLSDEIYGPLAHDGEHHSIAHFYPEGTIISGGLSKWCGAGGWRLGTFCFPQALHWLQDAMASLASETFTSTSAPIQHAAVTAFRPQPEIDAYLAQARRVLHALGMYGASRLREAGAKIHDPKGAFYLFPDFSPRRKEMRVRGISDSPELCMKALEATGVAFLPGNDFGMPENTLCARLAYVDFDGAAALQEAARVPLDQPLDTDFVKRHCQPTAGGFDKLTEWLATG